MQKFIIVKCDNLENINQTSIQNSKKEFENSQGCFDYLMNLLYNSIQDLNWLREYLIIFILSELRAMKKCPKSIRFLNKVHSGSKNNTL